jgi:hypothetical protein
MEKYGISDLIMGCYFLAVMAISAQMPAAFDSVNRFV